MKNCSKCTQELPFGNFYKVSNTKLGLSSQCRKCTQKRFKKYRLYNKEKILARAKIYYPIHKEKKRKNRYVREYGITFEDKIRMLGEQKSKCLICSNTISDITKAHVDHDHINKKIRGILCGYCNTGLGLFKDNTQILASAIAYLNKK